MKSSYDSYMKSPYSSIKHSTYFQVYDKFLSQFVGKEIVFVEVGVFNGGSLFMWRDYFGEKARIIGVDLNPLAKHWEDHGFEIFIGSQSDPAFWEDFKAQVGDIDVLLDDGGHTFVQQIVTVDSMLPVIKDGGYLIVEDTHTSYMREFGGPSRWSFVSFAMNMVHGLNFRFSKFKSKGKPHEDVVFGVAFYESIVVLEVDREKCAVQSKPVINDGETMNANDYRYGDSTKLIQSSEQLDRPKTEDESGAFAKFLAKKKRRISRLAKIVWNIRNNQKLKSFFKYNW